ncbi:MAG: hypothetical protein LBR10_13135 [Prevotellaceae bacterium]|jgi:DNA repair exonuclease SbcCD ATPase subunit|nr:hypothetical protein [Prevotellaceae bacterium]
MKKIIRLMEIMILCSTIGCSTQNIDKATYNKWVDYANSKYVEAYIETFRDNPKKAEAIKKYNDVIKPKLQASTPDKPCPFDKLSALLKNNGWTQIEENLARKFKENKQGNTIDDLLAIDMLDDKEVLEDTKIELKKELEDRIKEKEEKEKTEKDVKKQDNRRSSSKQSRSEKQHLYAICVMVLILGVFAVALQKSRKRIRKLNKKIRELNQQIGNPNQQIKELNQQLQKKEKQLQEKEKQLQEKEKQLQEKEKQLQELKTENNSPEPESTGGTPETDSQPQYFLTKKIGNSFHRISANPEDCFFRMLNNNGGCADFEFCGNVEYAIANKNAVFDEVCETSGYNRNVRHIKTEERGKVTLRDGKWVVTTKAKIKFE